MIATAMVGVGATIITGGACSVLAIDGTTGGEALAMAVVALFAVAAVVVTGVRESRGRL